MNISEIKERISIVDFLSKNGFEPKLVRGGEHVYLSPIRESDTDASFFVNDKQGKWFDHGASLGGNIIDLGLQLYNTPSVKEVLEKISSIYEGNVELPQIRKLDPTVLGTKENIEQNYSITSIKTIGTNPILLDYLKQRGLNKEVAESIFKEVYYTVENLEDDKKISKSFFSLGWQNDSGSWELRNTYFKGCLGHKDLTTFNIKPEVFNEKIAVFEGMFDYASWLQENEKRLKAPVIVLNSLAMIKKAVGILEKYQVPYYFLDNDKSGKEAVKKLEVIFPSSIDQSKIYEGFKDYNEWKVSPSKTVSIKR